MAPPGIAAMDLMELLLCDSRIHGNGACVRRGENHGQQRGRLLTLRLQLALEIGSPPIENLMRVHAFGLRYLRYACPRLKGQLHDPALLRNRSVYPLTAR